MPGYAFLGRKRSGKDTCADILCSILEKENVPYEKIAFAGCMKTALAEMFDVPEELFHDQTKKETKCIHNNQFSPRELLIWYGEMMMEKCGGPRFFVDIAVRKIRKAIEQKKVPIVTDLRTPVETYALMDLGFVVFHVDRDHFLGPLPIDSHFTESGVYVSKGILDASKYKHFVSISNDGTIDSLRQKLTTLVLGTS